MDSPVSAIVMTLFMEWLETEAIATAPIDCKFTFYGYRYVDDILEVIEKGQRQNLT